MIVLLSFIILLLSLAQNQFTAIVQKAIKGK